MSIGTRLYTWLHGKEVGRDSHGNRYFVERTPPPGRRPKRWVLYNGEAEASKVPAEWHAWLHYTTDEPLEAVPHKPWQQEHIPNLTGTPNAYFPPGDERAQGRRPRATGDYEAWRPE